MTKPQPHSQHRQHPDTEAGGKGGLTRKLVSPPVLFSLVALLVLAIIWTTTLNFIARDRASAERAAISMTSDVADTYEAQVVRALREIDHTLKLVRHELDNNTPSQSLQALGHRGLLPPGLLFTVSVADAGGHIVASTNTAIPGEPVPGDLAQRTRDSDAMVVGLPRENPLTGEWELDFARPLPPDNNDSAGLVFVSVPAGYFVSGYEADALGEQGVLGLLGTDGVFRVKRSGENIHAGEQIDYAALAPDELGFESPASLQINPWDNTRRYTIARELFEFPLAIVAGLSRSEQLAPLQAINRNYVLRAAGASLILLAITALLGRLSWRLQQEQNQIMRERIEHAREVEYLAFHDNLTNLANRAFFSQLLTQHMSLARRYNRKLALLFLDLDRFKLINDSLGHDAGDELLCEIARRLNHSVRESDITARLGGDEFVVMLPEIENNAQVTPVAEKILEAVAKPFLLVGREFRVTVSIGVTLYPEDGEDEQTLMKNADVAMYHAKNLGKNNFQFYSDELKGNSLERLTLESSLRKALESDEFRLYYQARRNIHTGRVTGMEALLRWEHPELGIILPMQFIPLAEENGLIIPIGRWVFRTACEQNVAWQKAGFPALSMAVNLSARQFIDENLLEDIKQALDETGMDPRLLEVEITESMVMQNMEQTIQILTELKQMGVKVAIDDFGTGYSSLATLKQFPLDTIKIDQSFIHEVADNDADQGLTRAIISVGKSLSLTVVAEGVETAGQFEYLRDHECDEFQGFYSNKPMPADKFEYLIRDQSPDDPDE